MSEYSRALPVTKKLYVFICILLLGIGADVVPVHARTNPACDRALNKGKDANEDYVVSMMRCNSLFPADEQYANALATWYFYKKNYKDSLKWSNAAISIGEANNAKYNGSESYYLGVSWLIKMFSEYGLASNSDGSWEDVKKSAIAASQLAGCAPEGKQATSYVIDKQLTKDERDGHCAEALLAFVNAQYRLGFRKKACDSAEFLLSKGMGSYKGMFDYDLSGLTEKCNRRAER